MDTSLRPEGQEDLRSQLRQHPELAQVLEQLEQHATPSNNGSTTGESELPAYLALVPQQDSVERGALGNGIHQLLVVDEAQHSASDQLPSYTASDSQLPSYAVNQATGASTPARTHDLPGDYDIHDIYIFHNQPQDSSPQQHANQPSQPIQPNAPTLPARHPHRAKAILKCKLAKTKCENIAKKLGHVGKKSAGVVLTGAAYALLGVGTVIFATGYAALKTVEMVGEVIGLIVCGPFILIVFLLFDDGVGKKEEDVAVHRRFC